jgi:methionine sulfoxide reductase heme-binding subunit
MAKQGAFLEGWRITWVAAFAVIAMALVILLIAGVNERGLHLVIRSTAQTSFALFLGAFAAAALLKLWPSRFSKWLRRNRRYVGVSFAASHILHAIAIIALASITGGGSLGETPVPELVGGGLAYAFILAMAATSSDKAVSLMGARRWSLLHAVGMYYIWLIFMFSYGGRAVSSIYYAPPALLLLIAMGMRLLASSGRPAYQKRAGA